MFCFAQELHSENTVFKINIHCCHSVISFPGDRDEHFSILEEAAAIGAIQKQVELQGSTGVQKVGLDEVTVAVLRDLQDSQDKELATVFYGITNLVCNIDSAQNIFLFKLICV